MIFSETVYGAFGGEEKISNIIYVSTWLICVNGKYQIITMTWYNFILRHKMQPLKAILSFYYAFEKLIFGFL